MKYILFCYQKESAKGGWLDFQGVSESVIDLKKHCEEGFHFDIVQGADAHIIELGKLDPVMRGELRENPGFWKWSVD